MCAHGLDALEVRPKGYLMIKRTVHSGQGGSNHGHAIFRPVAPAAACRSQPAALARVKRCPHAPIAAACDADGGSNPCVVIDSRVPLFDARLHLT